MDKQNFMYVMGCVFTRDNPEISIKIQDYLKQRWNIPVMRCCVPNYIDFTKAMPEWLRNQWNEIPEYINFSVGQTMLYVCHNCSAIFEEAKPEVNRLSLWELILQDEQFPLSNYSGKRITLQDCWRSFDNRAEQQAVRKLLQKMNFEVVELAENYEKTQFCGTSLYSPAPLRNLEMAPLRFVENAEGKFINRPREEQQALMHEHCRQISTESVVAYCHYCIKGLEAGGKKAVHLAELLFNN